MIEAPMPKDIMKYKKKFIGNFSLREAVFGALGVGMAALGFFVLFESMEQNLRIGLSFVSCMPFFIIGYMKIYDQPFEKMLYIFLYDNLICPARRPYETKYTYDIEQNNKQKKKIKPSRKYKGVR